MQWKWLPKELFGVASFDASELSPKARERLRALDLWRETKDVRLACRAFGMSRGKPGTGKPGTATYYLRRNQEPPIIYEK